MLTFVLQKHVSLFAHGLLEAAITNLFQSNSGISPFDYEAQQISISVPQKEDRQNFIISNLVSFLDTASKRKDVPASISSQLLKLLFDGCVTCYAHCVGGNHRNVFIGSNAISLPSSDVITNLLEKLATDLLVLDPILLEKTFNDSGFLDVISLLCLITGYR